MKLISLTIPGVACLYAREVSAFQPQPGPRSSVHHSINRDGVSALSLSRDERCVRDVGGSASACSRQDFLVTAAAGATAFLLRPSDDAAFAFEGGVGGLGKTKPETGVVFRDPDATCADPGPGGDVTNELLSPDRTPALVTFNAPWPMLRSRTSVESRDLANPEAAFVQVATLPKGKSAGDLPKSFFMEAIFGQRGKFGAYGAPSDVKVKKAESGSSSSALYVASFTTLTPGLRESERQAFISTSVVGDGVFMLVTGTSAIRFRKRERELRKVAESFTVVAAPKTELRK